MPPPVNLLGGCGGGDAVGGDGAGAGDISSVQDNAPCHKSGAVTKFLADAKVAVLPWPACSPDLSPIENLWGLLKQRVRARDPQSVERLVAIANEEWDKLRRNRGLLLNLFGSMEKRLRAVVDANGAATGY